MEEGRATMQRAIIVERVMPHTPEKVWRVLTTSELISEWLMPNDFQPTVGHRFSFQSKPMGTWNGLVDCQVLECDPPRRLRYSWTGGSDDNAQYGTRLISVVTWTLTPAEGGTRLRMEHDGFGPGNAFAYEAMSGGWARIAGKISELAGQLV